MRLSPNKIGMNEFPSNLSMEQEDDLLDCVGNKM